MEAWLPIIVPGLFIAVGVLFFGYGISGLQRATASSGWPQVAGRVLSSAIEEDQTEAGGYDHRLVVEFAYEVQGKDYTCREFFPSESGPALSRDAAQALQARIRSRDTVAVAYNPADPADATLYPGHHQAGWTYMVVGLATAAVGCYIIWHP
jgi:hypothetical protein